MCVYTLFPGAFRHGERSIHGFAARRFRSRLACSRPARLRLHRAAQHFAAAVSRASSGSRTRSRQRQVRPAATDHWRCTRSFRHVRRFVRHGHVAPFAARLNGHGCDRERAAVLALFAHIVEKGITHDRTGLMAFLARTGGFDSRFRRRLRVGCGTGSLSGGQSVGDFITKNTTFTVHC